MRPPFVREDVAAIAEALQVVPSKMQAPADQRNELSAAFRNKLGCVPRRYAFAAASCPAGLEDRSGFAVAAKYAPSAIIGSE